MGGFINALLLGDDLAMKINKPDWFPRRSHFDQELGFISLPPGVDFRAPKPTWVDYAFQEALKDLEWGFSSDTITISLHTEPLDDPKPRHP